MTDTLPPQAADYVRLRRRPGDPRLYITSNGSTESGYLASASIDIPGPILHLELEEHPSQLYSDGIDAAFYETPADRILLADVHALAATVKPVEHPYHQLLNALDTVRPSLADVVPPPCGHEDVVETPELGNPDTPGICMWCPIPLVRRHGADAWVPE